jgi:hypothetical protein
MCRYLNKVSFRSSFCDAYSDVQNILIIFPLQAIVFFGISLNCNKDLEYNCMKFNRHRHVVCYKERMIDLANVYNYIAVLLIISYNLNTVSSVIKITSFPTGCTFFKK